jgi:hypothetical protein
VTTRPSTLEGHQPSACSRPVLDTSDSDAHARAFSPPFDRFGSASIACALQSFVRRCLARVALWEGSWIHNSAKDGVATLEAVTRHRDDKRPRRRCRGRSDNSRDAPTADQAPGSVWQFDRQVEPFGWRSRSVRADDRPGRADASSDAGMPPGFTCGPVPHAQAQAEPQRPRNVGSLRTVRASPCECGRGSAWSHATDWGNSIASTFQGKCAGETTLGVEGAV